MDDEDLQEGRLVRKGLGLLYSRQSKTSGDKSVQHFNRVKQEGERDRGSKWGKEIFDQQKMTNTWLTYLLVVGIVILGFLVGNPPW